MALDRTPSGHAQGATAANARAAFVRDLRAALRHLYDPVALRQSPLLALLGLEHERDPLGALHRLLLGAIEALKPPPGTPAQANAWRTYQILYERYAEQFSQDEVAVHLAVGTRQLRRQESRALRLMADYLRARYGLAKEAATAPPPQPGAAEATPSREQELAWLRSAYSSESVSVHELVTPVLQVVAPLAQALHTAVEQCVPADLPRLMVQLTTVRQALSNVVTAAIRAAPGGRVVVGAVAIGQGVVIEVQASCPLPRNDGRSGQSSSPPPAPGASEGGLTPDDVENLELARRMVEFSGGSLAVQTGAGPAPFAARLTLASQTEAKVLVIDDNADTLHLMEHYLEGTPYRFTGTSSPQEALVLAEALAPHAILLDVMLPSTDGWELLGRLREHPQTRSVPVIVCTILAQEQLALTLGAAAFLRKPVARDALLETLQAVIRPA